MVPITRYNFLVLRLTQFFAAQFCQLEDRCSVSLKLVHVGTGLLGSILLL